jgi:hypothetical protein
MVAGMGTARLTTCALPSGAKVATGEACAVAFANNRAMATAIWPRRATFFFIVLYLFEPLELKSTPGRARAYSTLGPLFPVVKQNI